MILVTKTSDQARRRGHTLSRLLVPTVVYQFLLKVKPGAPCASLSASFIISVYPRSASSEPTYVYVCVCMYVCMYVCMFLCVCVVFSSHSFWTSSSLDVPAGVTQEEGHTGFLTHLSAVRALIFLARRIQPCLSLVDCEVEFCVPGTNDLIVLHPLGIFFFFFFSEKNSVCRGRTHVPTCQRVTRYL